MSRLTNAQLKARLKAQDQLTREVLAMKESELERIEAKFESLSTIAGEMAKELTAIHEPYEDQSRALQSYREFMKGE